MRKEEIKQYRDLIKERDKIAGQIRRLEKKAADVRTIKDKVQSSMKEYPYISTHEEVEAPEPKQYTQIQRNLYTLRLQDVRIYEELLRLNNYIASIPDSRERGIITSVFVEGKSQKDTAIEYDITDARVSEIIKEILEKYA